MWDETSPWPSDMIGYYKKMKVMAGGSPVSIAVNKYRNNDQASHPTPQDAGTQEAMKVKEALFSLNPGDAVARAGGSSNFYNVFSGKGAPQAIAAVLSTFADYGDKFVAKYSKRTYERDYGVRLTADLLGDPQLSWQDTLQ
jgi:hypothetical protein